MMCAYMYYRSSLLLLLSLGELTVCIVIQVLCFYVLTLVFNAKDI